MSKKEIKASEEDSQESKGTAKETAATQSDPSAEAEDEAAPTAPVKGAADETRDQTPDDGGASEDALGTEETSVKEDVSEEGVEDSPDEKVADDATDEALDGAGGDPKGDKGTKPRTRSRGRRSRSRRKPRSDGEDEQAPQEKAATDTEEGPKDKLRATALWGLHKERRAKMVPFEGYEMPVQYKRGIMAEHRQTRDRAGLFDVSHMGQAFLTLEARAITTIWLR